MPKQQPPAPPTDRLLTIKEVAELLQISERKVRGLIYDNQLRAVKVGRLVRIRPTDLDRLLR